MTMRSLSGPKPAHLRHALLRPISHHLVLKTTLVLFFAGFLIHDVIQQLRVEQLVLVLSERILCSLHYHKDLLFFQTAANNLHTDRKTMHAFGVVVFVRSGRNAVELPVVEGARELVEGTINMCDGNDAGCVVELLRREGVVSVGSSL